MTDPEPDFEEIFNAWPLRRYAARRVAPEAVQDVVSEIFLAAWRRRAELHGESLPRLLGIAAAVLDVPSAREGTGALVPGTVRLLSIAAPDPAGGPDWGMRELSTTRGQGCLQIGRLLDGKLGALGKAPTHAEVAAPIRALLVRGRSGRETIEVSFTARLRVTDARRIYGVRWRTPGMARGAYGGTSTNTDIPAGRTVTFEIPAGESPRSRPREGIVRGTVRLQQALGAGGTEGPGSVSVPVGSFAVRVP